MKLPLVLLLVAGLLSGLVGDGFKATPIQAQNQHQVYMPLIAGLPRVTDYEEYVATWNGGEGDLYQYGPLYVLYPSEGLQPSDPAGIVPFAEGSMVLPLSAAATDTMPHKVGVVNPGKGPGKITFTKLAEGQPRPKPFTVAPGAVGPGPIPDGAILGTVIVAGTIAGAVIGAPIAIAFLAAVGIGLVATYAIHELQESGYTADQLTNFLPQTQPNEALELERNMALALETLMAAERQGRTALSVTGQIDFAQPGGGGNDPCNYFNKSGGKFPSDKWYLRGQVEYFDGIKTREVLLEVREILTDKVVAYAHGTFLEGGSDVTRYGVAYAKIVDESAGGQNLATLLLQGVNEGMQEYANRFMNGAEVLMWFNDAYHGAYGSWRCYFSHNTPIKEPLPYTWLHPVRSIQGIADRLGLPNIIHTIFGGGGG